MMLDWNDTLLDYLASSNEDERVLQHLMDHVLFPLGLEHKGKPVRWLEVGPGPGTKTARFAECLRACSFGIADRMTLIEPSASWLRYLRLSGVTDRLRLFSEVSVVKLSLGEFLRGVEPDDSSHYEVTTMIHVLYSESLIADAVEYLNRKPRDRSGATYLVVESTDSDFSKMRESLKKVGLEAPSPNLHLLRSNLRGSGLDFREEVVNDQACEITLEQLASNEHWLFPFLLGMARSSFRALGPKVKEEVCGLTRDHVAKLGRRCLLVPDVAFIVEGN